MLLKKENVNQVQRQWRNEPGTLPSTCVTVAQFSNKFKADGSLQNVDNEHSENFTVQLTT
jgi:hypothetical protein